MCLPLCYLENYQTFKSSSSSSSSALQLFVSFGLLSYFFPFLPLLRRLFPIVHSHLPQVILHIVFPSYSWPSLRSCCIRFPFVYGLATLSLVTLSTCPNQINLLYFMYLTIFSLLNAFSNSFVLSLHSPFAFCVGPSILLNIFLSNTNNLRLMFFVKTQHSDPYTTTGLTKTFKSVR